MHLWSLILITEFSNCIEFDLGLRSSTRILLLRHTTQPDLCYFIDDSSNTLLLIVFPYHQSLWLLCCACLCLICQLFIYTLSFVSVLLIGCFNVLSYPSLLLWRPHCWLGSPCVFSACVMFGSIYASIILSGFVSVSGAGDGCSEMSIPAYCFLRIPLTQLSGS